MTPMTPVFSAGSLQVTPYSLMILAGALTGVLLSCRKPKIRPLLPAVILGALLFGHLVWVIFCPYSYEAPEGRLYMILRPWEGGYTLYGALLGGALGALIAGKLSGVRWLEAMDGLAPGACAVIFFARLGEYFTGEGVGRESLADWTHFFPLSVCTYRDEYFEEWRYVVWIWEALAALVLMVLLLKREKKALPGHGTVWFLTGLGTSQILLEQMRRDNFLRVHIFVRVNQLAALLTLILVLSVLLIRRRPGGWKAFWCAAALVFAALADTASEFVFDKYEYVPWLYIAAGLSAAVCSVMLWVWRRRKGLLPAAVVCVLTAVLLIAYASRPWEEMEMEPAEEMIRFLILYGTMAVDMLCIILSVRLNLKSSDDASLCPSR